MKKDGFKKMIEKPKAMKPKGVKRSKKENPTLAIAKGRGMAKGGHK